MKSLFLAAILAFALVASAPAQDAVIDWTHVHQKIDGFGATAPLIGDGNKNLTPVQQSLFFGSGSGELGLSILRVGLTDGHSSPGDCSTVSASCAGANVSDMSAAVANGARIYATPWSPPAAFKTNGSVVCRANGGNGTLKAASYGAYAKWIANFVESLKTQDNISVYALSAQNEPDMCVRYDSAVWSSGQLDKFIRNNLGPAFASAQLKTLIFTPETSRVAGLRGANGGGTCMRHPECSGYIGGISFHDYDASANSWHSVSAATNPWKTMGKKFWETEASCGNGFGPTGCEPRIASDMPIDGLMWAALLDDRLVRANVNAYLYWAFTSGTLDNEGLAANNGTIAKRAYVFGQYSRFVRPGSTRIEATHHPRPGVSVSAYQNNGTLVIVATNYTRAPITEGFSIVNAPSLASLTPYVTSPTQNIEAQSSVAVSSDHFSYTLPASSVTTFVSSAAAP